MKLSALNLLLALCLITGCAGTKGVTTLDSALYPEPPVDSITFWGHATSYIDVGGLGILTDPIFEKSYSPFHGRKIPAPPPEAYDQTRIVLISHAHRDHLSPATLRRLPKSAVVLCSEPSRGHVEDTGLKVRVMQPGDEYPFPGGSVIAVAAHHPGGRNSGKARHDGRAIGFIIRTPHGTVYYSGDTEFWSGLYDIGRTYRPHIAILNINAHLNSLDAEFAIAALGIPQVIISHWGAYGGSNARRSPGWHAELRERMGEVILPLEVGGTIPITGDVDSVSPLAPVP